jgi:hypothetical protein
MRTIAPNYATIVQKHYHIHGDLRLFIFPQTFNELIQCKRTFVRHSLITLTSDKYKVRQYVKEKIGERYLVPLLTVVDDPRLIDFSNLPDSFVIKANHGSGFNFFVDDKGKVDRTKLIETVAAWLKIDFASYHGEWGYSNIERRVLVEEKLMQGGEFPDDYKFFVFNGRVRLVQLDQGRQEIHRQNLYDEEWRQLAVEYVSPRSSQPCQPPAQLSEMIELAEVLAQDFEFARIDLYLVDGKIFFGEVTHYPNAGLIGFKPREFDRVLGEVWRKGTPIPSKYYLPPAEPSVREADRGIALAVPSVLSANEHRNNLRPHGSLSAMIYGCDGGWSRPCILSDLSDRGAEISGVPVSKLPNHFMMAHDLKPRRCHVLWRATDALRVEFVDDIAADEGSNEEPRSFARESKRQMKARRMGVSR